MKDIQKHLNLLGKPVKDKVTGKTGVITSISFDLYGCIQAIITPKTGKDNKDVDLRWYDLCRLKVTSDKRVMILPDFETGQVAEGKRGCENKPTL